MPRCLNLTSWWMDNVLSEVMGFFEKIKYILRKRVLIFRGQYFSTSGLCWFYSSWFVNRGHAMIYHPGAWQNDGKRRWIEKEEAEVVVVVVSVCVWGCGYIEMEKVCRRITDVITKLNIRCKSDSCENMCVKSELVWFYSFSEILK